MPSTEHRLCGREQPRVNSSLRLQVRIVHADSDSECDAVVHAPGGGRSGGGGGGGGKKRRRTEKKHAAQTQQHSTRDLLRRIGELSATACDALSTAPSATPCTVVASATRASVSIAGRYRKLRRGLSQTPFFVDNVRRFGHAGPTQPGTSSLHLYDALYWGTLLSPNTKSFGVLCRSVNEAK